MSAIYLYPHVPPVLVGAGLWFAPWYTIRKDRRLISARNSNEAIAP